LNIDPVISERVIDFAEKIQQIPAPTFGEHQRAEFIRRSFIELGCEEVILDDTGNVFARIRGQGMKKPVVVSAHIDTVFPESTDLSILRTQDKVSGPGIGDNSLGLAGLFGLYWILGDLKPDIHAKTSLAADTWLVANVGEEGLGNLFGMKAVVERFNGEASAYIILEGMSLGQIYHRGLGVKRYRITVNTKGGHSWVDYGKTSAIHELAELVVKIKNLDFPAEPRTSFNIGTISGGTSVNTIAAEASMQLDLRSVDPHVLSGISNQVEALVGLANYRGKEELQVVAQVIGERPPGDIPADHPLVKLAEKCHIANGVKVKLNIGSTDANEPLSHGYPAICMGLTTGGGAHTTSEYIDIKPIGLGLKILADLIQGI
jgi:acetylornithine deacetylase/succinyl-diaminopimelate desuccinylase-like protein